MTRATSDRRKEPNRRRYEGDPGTPIADRGFGPYVAVEGEPSVWCPACQLPIRKTPSGRMHTHAEGGHHSDVKSGHPPCLGSPSWNQYAGAEEKLITLSVKEAQAQQLVTAMQLGRAFDLSRSAMSGVAHRPWFPSPVARLEGGNAYLWDARAAVTQVRWALATGRMRSAEQRAESIRRSTARWERLIRGSADEQQVNPEQ